MQSLLINLTIHPLLYQKIYILKDYIVMEANTNGTDIRGNQSSRLFL